MDRLLLTGVFLLLEANGPLLTPNREILKTSPMRSWVGPYFLRALQTIVSEADAASARLSLGSKTDMREGRVAWRHAQEAECATGPDSARITADIRETRAHGIISAMLPGEKTEDRLERLAIRTECEHIAGQSEIARETFVEAVVKMSEQYADRSVDP
jgi:hypothetical protein